MKIPIPAFFNRLPSLLTEQVGALVAVLLGMVATLPASCPPLAVFLAATGLSFVYERWLDENGFSWMDIGQREIGIVVFSALWYFFR